MYIMSHNITYIIVISCYIISYHVVLYQLIVWYIILVRLSLAQPGHAGDNLKCLRRASLERVGKGQMGSALTGSLLHILCFLTEGLSGYSRSPTFISSRAYLFPQSVKMHYFCSGPISVDPICPQPNLLVRGISGKSPMDLRIPPLKLKIVLTPVVRNQKRRPHPASRSSRYIYIYIYIYICI